MATNREGTQEDHPVRQPGTEGFYGQLGFLRMNTVMVTPPAGSSPGWVSADREGYGLRPTAQN